MELHLLGHGGYRIRDCHKPHETSGPTTPGSLQFGGALTFYTCILKVLSSNLGCDKILTDLSYSSSVPPSKFRDSISIRPRRLPSKLFPSHQSPIFLPFDRAHQDMPLLLKKCSHLPSERLHVPSITFCTPCMTQTFRSAVPERDHVPVITRYLLVLYKF
jgi:hypothetical protein